MKLLLLMLTFCYSAFSTPLLHYTLKGSGAQTIVMIHGFATHQGIWNNVVDQFAQTYQVLTLDLRGHGASFTAHSDYRVETFAEDINRLITACNIKSPILVGWSLGGYIAQYYATQFPTSKLVLVCTCPTWIAEPGFPVGSTKEERKEEQQMLLKTPLAYYEACINANFTDHCGEQPIAELATRLRSLLVANDVQALANVVGYFTDTPRSLVSTLPKIAVPTLIISGGRDPISPVEVGHFMQQRIPSSQLYQVPCGGHSLIQTRPVEFVRVVTNFLEERPLGQSPCYHSL